jgi:hypothetical protein
MAKKDFYVYLTISKPHFERILSNPHLAVVGVES